MSIEHPPLSRRAALRLGVCLLLALLLAAGGFGLLATSYLHAVQGTARSELAASAGYRTAFQALAPQSPAQYILWARATPPDRASATQANGLVVRALSALDDVVSPGEAASTVADLSRDETRYRDAASLLFRSRGRDTPLVARAMRPLFLAMTSRSNALAALHTNRAANAAASVAQVVGWGRLGLILFLSLALMAASLVLWGAGVGRHATPPNENEWERLQRDAVTDVVTGVGNGRAFRGELEREVARGSRHGTPLALALLDIDGYGLIAERLGTRHGEDLLRYLSTFLVGRRPEDRSFRLDGGRFALILPHTTAREVYGMLESVRQRVQSDGQGVTLSAGVADLTGPRDTVPALQRRAEAALSEARAFGGNTVMAYATRRGRDSSGDDELSELRPLRL